MTEVQPDWKTPPPDRDPDLLQDIHEAWQPFGCAVCGYQPSPRAEPGGQIEVHHLRSRGQGGEDSWENTLGLCGEFCPQKCHWRVTTNRLSIDFVVGVGWVWTDLETGEEGICRDIHGESLALGPTHEETQEDLRKLGLRQVAITPDKLPDVVRLPGVEGAEARFQLASQLWQRLSADLLTLTLLIGNALQTKEWALLGFGSPTEYADAIGIPSPTLSKMRGILRAFEGEWTKLPEADQKELSLDRLYYAARLYALRHYPDAATALSEAVAHPQRYLYEAYMEEKLKKQGEEQHKCPDCGFSHTIIVKDE